MPVGLVAVKVKVRTSLQSVRAPKQPWLRGERSDKWVLEDNTACYGQEKKLSVNIAIWLSLSLSLSVSHTS